jgi:hypothetical protein
MEQLALPYPATEVAAKPATATLMSARRKRVQRRPAKPTANGVTRRRRGKAEPTSQAPSRAPDPVLDSAEFADRGALCAMSGSELDAVALDLARESLVHVLWWRAWVSLPRRRLLPEVGVWQGAISELAAASAVTPAELVRWLMRRDVLALLDARASLLRVLGRWALLRLLNRRWWASVFPPRLLTPAEGGCLGCPLSWCGGCSPPCPLLPGRTPLVEVLRARALQLGRARPSALEKTEVPSGAAE